MQSSSYHSFDNSDQESIQSGDTTSHFSVRELLQINDDSTSCSSYGTDKVRYNLKKDLTLI